MGFATNNHTKKDALPFSSRQPAKSGLNTAARSKAGSWKMGRPFGNALNACAVLNSAESPAIKADCLSIGPLCYIVGLAFKTFSLFKLWPADNCLAIFQWLVTRLTLPLVTPSTVALALESCFFLWSLMHEHYLSIPKRNISRLVLQALTSLDF